MNEQSAVENSFSIYVFYGSDGLFWLNLYQKCLTKLNKKICRAILNTAFDPFMLWLTKERNCFRFNWVTFRLPCGRSLCCRSKEFASKKRKKLLERHSAVVELIREGVTNLFHKV